MAIHTVRDYFTQNITTNAKQWIAGYLMGIFLRRILTYSYVGDTNYPINNVGTLLISTADTTPTAAPTFPVNTKAGINQGTGREFYVWIPPSVRAVQLADVGRLLVLRSTANSTYNSGIFLITGLEALSYTVSTTSGNGISPIQITTTAPHTLTTGQTVTISGVTGNTNANDTFTITVLDNLNFTLNGTTGNGLFSGGGTVVTNCYIVDFRTMGSTGFPPVEAFDSMNWYIYERDTAAPPSGAQNSTWNAVNNGTYGGYGNSTTPRIIMQSPHSLGWQVRLCHESFADYSQNFTGNGNYGNVPTITAMPGFGGNASGDFAVAGPHLHGPLYYNTNNTIKFAGTAPGFGDDSSVNGPPSSYWPFSWRITIVGDDTGLGVVIFGRRQFTPNTNISVPQDYFCVFGMTENEPLPLPVNPAARLYVIGSGISTGGNSGYGDSLNDISWSPNILYLGSFNDLNRGPWCQGASQTQGGIPCSCVPSIWTYVSGVGQFGSPMFDGSAADSPWSGSTELFSVDALAGTFATWNGNPNVENVYPFEPRVIGTIPHLRSGRSNFGNFTVTTDGTHSWMHMKRGIYVTWNGPQVIP